MLQVEYIGEEPVPRDIVDAANKKVEQVRAKGRPLNSPDRPRLRPAFRHRVFPRPW